MRLVWQMSEEEYANSVGSPKVYPTLAGDASMTQLQFMSDSHKARIRKEKSSARREASKRHRDAVSEWREQVSLAYNQGKFSLLDVYDTDAFYVVRDIIENAGVDIDSPFRISQREDRNDYLAAKDQEYCQRNSTNQPETPRNSRKE